MSDELADGFLPLQQPCNRTTDGDNADAEQQVHQVGDMEANEPMLNREASQPKWWLPLARQAMAALLTCMALAAVSLAVVALALMAETEQLSGGAEERLIGTPVGSDPPEGSGYFLQITDFHLDPEYNASFGPACFCNRPEDPALRKACLEGQPNSSGNQFGQHGCDSPIALVDAVLDAALANAPAAGYDWVLVTGDFVRHMMHRSVGNDLDNYESRVRDVIRTVTEAIEMRFPRTPLHHHAVQMAGPEIQVGAGIAGDERSQDLYGVGNNDFAGNYNITGLGEHGTNDWFGYIEPLLNKSLGPKNGVLRSHHTFKRGGYYMRRLTRSLYLIFLDTVIYSHHEEAATAHLEDPFGQLEWLEKMLMWIHQQPLSGRMEPKKAIIAGHIPPTIDSFHFTPLWSERFVDRYVKIVTRYAFVVSAQIYAHLHANSFRLFPSRQIEQPLFLTSAVSPVYQNNPGFRVWRYEGCHLLDYTDYSAELRTNGPQSVLNFQAHTSARDMFGLKALTAGEWREKVADRIRNDDKVWRRYVDELWWRPSGELSLKGTSAKSSKDFRARSVCAIENVHKKEFELCVHAWAKKSSQAKVDG